MSEHFDPELEEILQARRRAARNGFLGGALMAVGGLIATLSGLCSLLFLAAMVVEVFRSHNGGDVVMVLTMVAVVGGVPFAVGAGLFLLGRRIRREPTGGAAPDA